MNNKEAGGGAQGAQGSSKNCTSRESVSPLSRLIRGFRNKYQISLISPWEDQCKWHRMTRMIGPDCEVMCNLINTHTHMHTIITLTHTAVTVTGAGKGTGTGTGTRTRTGWGRTRGQGWGREREREQGRGREAGTSHMIEEVGR